VRKLVRKKEISNAPLLHPLPMVRTRLHDVAFEQGNSLIFAEIVVIVSGSAGFEESCLLGQNAM
jgi:hypothetical protein